jgi:hypothetical protein
MLYGNAEKQGSNTPKKITENTLLIGYHLKMQSVTVHADKTTTFEVKNTGVAPLYRDAYVAIDGRRSTQSLRFLEPGRSMTVRVAGAGPKSASSITIDSEWSKDGRLPFEADLTVAEEEEEKEEEEDEEKEDASSDDRGSSDTALSSLTSLPPLPEKGEASGKDHSVVISGAACSVSVAASTALFAVAVWLA